MRHAFTVCFAIFTSLALSHEASADHRVALLIANSAYEGSALRTPAPSVRAIDAALVLHGFRTDSLENLKQQDFRKAIENWAATVPTNATAVIYFTGYALPGDVKGKADTCLMPVDAKAQNERDAGSRGYGVRELLDMLGSRCGAQNIIVLVDGSFAWPKQSFERTGAVAMDDLPANTMLAFAAEPGHVVEQNSGDLSPMATALTKQLSHAKVAPINAIKASAAWVRSTLNESLTLAGQATQPIAAPTEFRKGVKAGDEWVNGQGMVFCWCPPGSYTMGSPDDMPGKFDDEAQSQVTFTEGFWISKYEVTIRENPRKSNPRNMIGKEKNHPVTMIHHGDGRSMARKTLTEAERKAGHLPADWEYDLPTEKEWEYAARAGSKSRFYFGDDISQLPLHANFADKAAYDSGDFYLNYAHRTLDDGSAEIAKVGSYKPNPWGLNDVYGNVAEWCAGQEIRGGSFLSTPENCRSAYRHHWPERNERNFIGYRFVIRKVITGSDTKK